MGALALVVAALLIYVVVRVVQGLRDRAPKTPQPSKFCTYCGSVGSPEFRREGSDGLELLLWLLFLIPGIVYSIWRNSAVRWVCPSCGLTGMTTSQFANQFTKGEVSTKPI